ncbi:MAG: hypothetical protein U9Q78_04260 [Chloroflexota bacterium]|nr:hypothetical protein [Chloroflexota bacterium]
MAKKSKLREKGTRMPDIRQAKWEQVVSEYLESVRSQERACQIPALPSAPQ